MKLNDLVIEETGKTTTGFHSASLKAGHGTREGDELERSIEYPLFPRHLQGMYLKALDGKGHVKWCCCGLHVSGRAVSGEFSYGSECSKPVSKAANLRVRTLATALYTVPSKSIIVAKSSL